MASIITTVKSVIEADIIGTGKPVLILHGSPGGIDAARAMCRFLPEEDFRCILVSRPGYLNTPLNSKQRSIDDEADLLAVLLDTMEIPRVGIVAWSGGGPAAYRFAVRHPNRVTALVTNAAVSFALTIPRPGLAQRVLFGTHLGERIVEFLTRHCPAQVVGGALEGEGSVRGEALKEMTDLAMADPKQRLLILEIARTMNIAGQRRDGYENDLANFAAIDSLELELIKCSTLIFHGDSDTDAPVEHGRFAHRNIPNSEYVELEGGTHLAFYAHAKATEVQNQAMAFLARYS